MSLVTAGYLSPVVAFDSANGLVVLQFRESTNGEIKDQIPSVRAAGEYRARVAHAEALDVAKRERAGPTLPSNVPRGSSAGSSTAIPGFGVGSAGTGTGTPSIATRAPTPVPQASGGPSLPSHAGGVANGLGSKVTAVA